MEQEEYFTCPVCGKKTLKREGVLLMWTKICKDCFQFMEKGRITKEKEEKV